MIRPSQLALQGTVLVLCLLVIVPAFGRDSFQVATFRSQFINWATPVLETFSFPEEQLYTQVLCHMTIACPSSPADCDPWDRFGNLKLRHHTGPDTHEDYEIARFITPYDITFSGGPNSCAWTLDVTAYQFLLHDDVDLQLYIESWMGNDNGWLVTIVFEFFPGVPEREPFAIERLWSTGNLRYGDPDLPVADFFQTRQLTVPESATWTEVRTFSTGHGFWNTDNAAEFSSKWQQLLVDSDRVQHYLWRGDCAQNECSPQQGTWQYNRAGWCPGDGAAAWVVDVSSFVQPGEQHDFNYNLQPYTNLCRPNNPDCNDHTGCDCAGHAYYKHETQVVFYRVPGTSGVEDGRILPGRLHLVGNYPNPFNPATTIRYHIDGPGAATVGVYDAEGSLIRQVQRDHGVEGAYEWTWDGRGPTGQLMPSGVYLYKVECLGEEVSAKMLLLK